MGAGLHVRTCRDAPPHPWLVESTYLVTPNPHTKFEHNRSNRFWDTEAPCARAHVHIQPMTCVKHLVHDPQLTHQNWTQSAKPFLRYRSAVCTCARAEIPHPWLVLSTYIVHEPQPTHQNWAQSAEPFLRYRNAVCTCARAETPHPWLVVSS